MIALVTVALALAATPPPAPGCPAAADLHVDLPYHVQYRRRAADLTRPGSDVTADSLAKGCVKLVVASLYVPHGLKLRRAPVSELLKLLDTAEALARRNGWIAGAGPPTDSPRVVYGVEGSQVLTASIDRLPALVARGVRLFGLVHAYHNDLADSATDPHAGRGGLTEAGERFVEAVYRAGALVDVSHASAEAFWDVARIAKRLRAPLVATHSNARAVCDHPRNLDDAQLRAVAASGGVVGVMFHAPFVRCDRRPATLADLVRHVRHLLDVAGPEHVALGSDIDGLIRPVAGLRTHAGLPALRAALAEAGVPAATLDAIWWGNAVRVLSPRTAPRP